MQAPDGIFISWPATLTSLSSFSSSTARCTMGPRTAYSTFFTVGFMLSMVSTLPRDIVPLSDIFVLGSARRVVLKLDKALPGEEEEDKGGEVSERNPGTPPPQCGPPQPGKNSALRPGLRSRRVLGEINCTRVADMLHKV